MSRWDRYLGAAGVLFASVAAKSCGEFLRYGPYPAGEPHARLFVLFAVLAGGPLVLASFRAWRRHQGETWPTIALSGRIAAAGFACSAAGFSGALAMATVVPLRVRSEFVGMTLIAVAGTGLVVMLGALELLVISVFAEIRGRSRAI